MLADDQVLSRIYQTVTSDDQLHLVLGLLAERFACPSAVLLYVDPNRSEADIALGFGIIDAEVQRRYTEEYAQYDPAPAAMAKLALGQAATTDTIFAGQVGRYEKFLREFYYPLGLEGALGGPIANQDGRFGVLAVHRGPERARFGSADIAAFEALLPHVIQAFELRRAFFQLQVQTERLQAALDPVPCGILVLSAAGHLRHANRIAREILDRRDALILERKGRLVAHNAAGNSLLSEAMAKIGRGVPATVRLPRAGSNSTYSVRLARMRLDSPASAPEILVLIHDPDRPLARAASVLATVFQLTPSGALLLDALIGGDDLKSYADRSGISLETARYHLKALFAATGTRRQTDLVKVASILVRDLALD